MYAKNKDYSDIISLPHHRSEVRAHMTVHNRAAQFAAFAALSGYDNEVKETERLTDRRLEIDEYERERLDQQLGMLGTVGYKNSFIQVKYFIKDERKDGGAYVEIVGSIKKLDYIERCIVMQGGERIPVDDIVELSPVEERR